MRGREADALDARNRRDVVDQSREIGAGCRPPSRRVGVDVLAEQRDLAHALAREVRDLVQHLLERAADFLAARVGHDAEAAVLAAAFHDRNEGGGALRARRGQVVELLDLGEADVDLRAARALAAPRSSRAGGAGSAGRTPGRRTGARAVMPSPSWLATQPPTPIIRCGRCCLSCRHSPSRENTFSCAFSRTEQVLNRITSACAGSSVRVHARGRLRARPPSCPSRTRSSGSRRSLCKQVLASTRIGSAWEGR